MTTQVKEDLDLETSYPENQEQEQEKMPSGLHGEVGTKILTALANYVYPKNLGRVFMAQTSFVVGGTPPIRQPDVSFVASEKIPEDEDVDEDIPFAPDLAIEIVSRSDMWSEVIRRSWNYVQAGTRLVWVIDPYTLNVLVFSFGKPMQTLTVQDELDGEDVIPGFKLPIKSLFRKSRLARLNIS